MTDDTRSVVDRAGADRRMTRTTLTSERGGIDAAIATFAEQATPKLLIIEVEEDASTLFAKLDRLAEICPPDTIVILLGACNDVMLYRDLKRNGISEYLVTPIQPLELINSIADLFEEDTERRAPVTAFVGARGGAGTSTLAQNTAWLMAHRCSTSVLLIDFDMAAGTCGFRLDLDPTMTVATALEEGERLDKTVLDRMIQRGDSGFSVLCSPADLTDISDYEMTNIRRLVDVARTMTSHVVLDLPSRWSRTIQGFLELADQVVLVAAPDLVSLRNGGKIAQNMRRARPNDPPPLLALSQIGVPRCQQIPPEQFTKTVGLDLRAEIPFDAATFSAAENEGRLVAQAASGSGAAKSMAPLASVLSGQEVKQSGRRRGLLPRLRRALS
ncbi:cellulose synthase operon protein YhjQ/BcsQ [uncultured Roseobacter sp.]|uniref:AAA family ATPase n=1 Tax=uncultured Roseobacter sp. TaxID=114847 RepID=UPI0026395497|nr:cellulose synthase operon protein YhjQ/BcsQ [uncultured Roseobacter sp.]